MNPTAHQSGSTPDAGLIPGAFSPRFARAFAWYVAHRLLPRRFHAVRIVRDTLPAAAGLDDHDGPLIVLLNHPSWWDPITATLLAYRLFPSRSVAAPIDADQLRRFRFFRRLGLFGIDPDAPASAAAMSRYIADRFAAEPRPTLWITPQGEFTDARAPVRLRPGAAVIASEHPRASVLCVALEYAFWDDPKPEVLIRLERCTTDRPTTTGWLRAMTEAMQRNQDALASLSIARSPEPFAVLVGGRGERINPAYDLWLRLRGRAAGPRPRQRDHREHRRHTPQGAAP